MATDDDERSPFTRPGFIAAAVVIALVVVLGIVLVIVNATDEDDPGPTPTSTASTSAAPTPDTTAVAGGKSVCGLDGEVLTGTVTTAPEAEWKFQGTMFMAANAVAQGSDPATSAQWASLALADGRYREQLLSQVSGGSSSEGTRLSIAGFRILNYDGSTARVDLGTKVSSGGQNVTMSAVYELVWQGGDWKISSDVQAPIDAASIPDLAGYITWGE